MNTKDQVIPDSKAAVANTNMSDIVATSGPTAGLSRLLKLVDQHNSKLGDLENKFRKEFKDIKKNLKKIRSF